MKYQVKKISAVQSSKVTAIMYAPFGLFYTLIGIAMLNNGNPKDDVLAQVLLAGPILLSILVFVMTLFTCWLYNCITSKVGGIEIELEEK